MIRVESLYAGLYDAENPVSSASGIAQIIDGTGRAWAGRIGIRWKGHASWHSHYEQDHLFIYGLRHNRSAWNYDC